MKIYIVLLIALLCSACEHDHIYHAHRIRDSFTNEMEKEGYFLFSSGGAMMGDIKRITLDYCSEQYLTVEETRLLMVEKSQKLLNQINSDPEIRPFLHNYPFTLKNLSLRLSFEKKNGDFVDPPYIAYAFIVTTEDAINYSTYSYEKSRLVDAYDEPYEEALRIYNETMANKAACGY